MKEADKFKKIAHCRLVKREHALANITPIRFMEIFNKKFDNVNHENIFKVHFAANGKHLEPEEDVYSPVSNKETIRIFIAL
eukprot:snap_masked-scaffold_10-processed-gene-2.35-mRNA-1 protein AED:1.00 eAED:1.00 QI:0/-1/0/0/-1/1/1/0/80